MERLLSLCAQVVYRSCRADCTPRVFSQSRVFCSEQDRNSGSGAYYNIRVMVLHLQSSAGFKCYIRRTYRIVCKQLLARMRPHTVKSLHEFM